MGQQEVYKFLEEHPEKWFYIREVSDLIRLSYGSVSYSMKQLRKGGLVLCKGHGWVTDEYRYKFKE